MSDKITNNKIEMSNPIVEIDGDEMTRVLWPMVKEKLIKPYVALKTDYYDLQIKKRDETEDRITIEAAEAIKKHKVGVKNATITPNAARVKEYNLKDQYKSPNGTIRAILDGTVFRKPIMVKNIKPAVRNWTKPIILGRHAYGDVYKNAEMRIPAAGRGELVYTSKDGKEKRTLIQDFSGPGILQGIHNTDQSIRAFAHACFSFALDQKVTLWFAAKDTISKTYDHHFREIFEEIFQEEYEPEFKKTGIDFFYTLIDDAIARIMRIEGGILWACKNYDGDVMSDMIASAYGSLAMMTSVLVSPHGYFEYEAAHGTVQKHFSKHQKGEKTSTNSVALIFAWAGALEKRGELDGNSRLVAFTDTLRQAVLDTIESGIMTGDLARICDPPAKKVVYSEEFLDAVADRLSAD